MSKDKKESAWRCDKCKKPETTVKNKDYSIVGCAHYAVLISHNTEFNEED